MLEVGNTSSTSLTSGQVIPFTNVYHDTNSRMTFNQSSNALVIQKSGLYKCGGNFVFTPQETGNISISMYVNGVQEPSAISTITVASGDTYTFTIPSKYIRTIPSSYGNTVPITFVVSGAGTLSNANAFVYYVGD